MTLGHLRHNAVAYLALVVALSTGSAYAAAQIANGSVTTKKLAGDAVTSQKIRNQSVKAIDLRGGSVSSFTIGDNSITSADVNDGSLSSVDVLDGSLTGADIKDDSITRADILGTVVPGDADIFLSTPMPGGTASVAPAQTAQNPFTFTTERNGKLAIEFFSGLLGVECGAGQGQVAIFIDGALQPGTLTNVPGTSAAGAVQIVTNQFLPAGAHTLTTSEYCLTGAHVQAVDQRVTWQVQILAR